MSDYFETVKDYNGVADKLPKNDKRIPKFIKQHQEQGWDDTYTWNLDSAIIKFTLPKLKRFKEVSRCHPGSITEEQWDTILEKMIIGFELFLDGKNGPEVEEAFELFFDYFFDLWW